MQFQDLLLILDEYSKPYLVWLPLLEPFNDLGVLEPVLLANISHILWDNAHPLWRDSE